MDGFREGYEYFEKSAGIVNGAFSGSAYIARVEKEIESLSKDINAMKGFQTAVDKLKGDVAEFWHSGTFNIDAVLKDSKNRTFVDRSHDFASADISSNFGGKFGLKYYSDGSASAKQQAKSLFERYKEYQQSGGKDTLEKFMTDRNFDPTDVSALNNPIYAEQFRLIPADQLKEAQAYLAKKIAKEQTIRPEQVKRYQDTLDKLCVQIEDAEGNRSIPLTKDDAEALAALAKEGGFDPAQWGLTTKKLVSYQYIAQQAFKAGTTAAIISLVLKVAPELYRTISCLAENGDVDAEQFKKLGIAALSGSAEGFVRGSIAAAITTACKAGKLGAAMKSIDPSLIGAGTVIAMNAVQNAFAVATGKMERKELTEALLKDLFISSCSFSAGTLTQGLLIELPVVGFMMGSFIGSMLGGILYSSGYQTAISFCVDTGFTMFGLVEQDYVLPENILHQIGAHIFEYEQFAFSKFDYNEFVPQKFTFAHANVNRIEISFLRRGVIGIRKIGYT